MNDQTGAQVIRIYIYIYDTYIVTPLPHAVDIHRTDTTIHNNPFIGTHKHSFPTHTQTQCSNAFMTPPATHKH